MTTQADETIAFGDYEISPAEGELRRLGRPIRLKPQPFKLLALLVARAGLVVSREEIRKELWAEDTFVDFDQGVNFCVRQIREALGDDAERPVFVQTVPKRGYRFIAPTRPREAAARPVPGPDTKLMRALWTNIAEIKLTEERRRGRRLLLLSLAGAAIVAALITLAIWR